MLGPRVSPEVRENYRRRGAAGGRKEEEGGRQRFEQNPTQKNLTQINQTQNPNATLTASFRATNEERRSLSADLFLDDVRNSALNEVDDENSDDGGPGNGKRTKDISEDEEVEVVDEELKNL